MRTPGKPLILALTALVAVSALAVLAILFFRPGGLGTPAASGSPAASGPTRPPASPNPTSGPVTLVRVTGWSNARSDFADPSAPELVSVSLMVVPGADLVSGNLEFSLISAVSSAAASPAPLSPASGPPFDPTLRQAQSFSLSFLVPASVSSGTLVVSLPGGSELFRQQLGWIVTP